MRIFRHKVIDGTVRSGGWAERSLPSISYGKALADELRMLSLIDGRDCKICDIDRALAMRVPHKFSGRHTVFARAMRLWRCSHGPSLNMHWRSEHGPADVACAVCLQGHQMTKNDAIHGTSRRKV